MNIPSRWVGRMTDRMTVGGYLASRLAGLGVTHYFGVPGDYNLSLLDELLKNESMTYVGCCNELNAGYSADGYARAHGLGVVVTTFSVGSLSAINAVAGAYAEDLPVILVSGGPNNNSVVEQEHLHHTIGGLDYLYPSRQFASVTVHQEVVKAADTAPQQIDAAIRWSLAARKPVYLEIAANLAGAPCSLPQPHDFSSGGRDDPKSLSAAIDHAAQLLNRSRHPMLVAGAQLKAPGCREAFAKLANTLGCAVAVMPDAKGLFDETNAQFVGVSWGAISSPGVNQISSAADLTLFAGPVFTDYTTTGHTMVVPHSNMIEVTNSGVRTPDSTFTEVSMAAFLEGLAQKVTANSETLDLFAKQRVEQRTDESWQSDQPVTSRCVASRINSILTGDTTLVVETGDSWFHAAQMNLPTGCGYEIQLKYGSIGWSVGAAMGFQFGSPGGHLVVAMIGDGSFQMTAQEVSTMVRHSLPLTIFLMDNGAYTIEVEIHDGPYNVIQQWDYAKLMDVFGRGGGKAQGIEVTTVGELDAAIAAVKDFDGVSLVQIHLDKDDCSPDLFEWGAKVALNNSRAPISNGYR